MSRAALRGPGRHSQLGVVPEERGPEGHTVVRRGEGLAEVPLGNDGREVLVAKFLVEVPCPLPAVLVVPRRPVEAPARGTNDGRRLVG